MTLIAVLGIGNNLLQDDGAGIHTLEHFAREHSGADVRCIDAGTVGLAIMDRLTGLDGLVAIDAMRLGKSPGTVTVLQDNAMDVCLRNHHGSAHEVGLADLMDALRLSGELPENRALVGIEPENIGWGLEPTACVAAAIPRAATNIAELVDAWRRDRNKEHSE
jgi:hydrogenase maturation protease